MYWRNQKDEIVVKTISGTDDQSRDTDGLLSTTIQFGGIGELLIVVARKGIRCIVR